jgi:hypothetical protein
MVQECAMIQFICDLHECFRQFRKISNSDCQLRHVCLSTWKTSAPNGGIFIKVDSSEFFGNLARKLKID